MQTIRATEQSKYQLIFIGDIMSDNIIFEASVFAVKQVFKQISENRKAKKSAKRKYCK